MEGAQPVVTISLVMVNASAPSDFRFCQLYEGPIRYLIH